MPFVSPTPVRAKTPSRSHRSTSRNSKRDGTRLISCARTQKKEFCELWLWRLYESMDDESRARLLEATHESQPQLFVCSRGRRLRSRTVREKLYSYHRFFELSTEPTISVSRSRSHFAFLEIEIAERERVKRPVSLSYTQENPLQNKGQPSPFPPPLPSLIQVRPRRSKREGVGEAKCMAWREIKTIESGKSWKGNTNTIDGVKTG